MYGKCIDKVIHLNLLQDATIGFKFDIKEICRASIFLLFC